MTQVHVNNCYVITIEYKHQVEETKPAKYVLKFKNIKKSYSIPQDASKKSEEMSILLKQFYADLNLDLPKNGFNLFNLTEGSHIAIPLQN